jgi:hypothetical protein
MNRPSGPAGPPAIKPSELDAFTRAYIEAALWSSTDSGYLGEGHPDNDPQGAETGGNPLDDHFSVNDLAPEALAQAAKDCADFRAYCAKVGLDLSCQDDGQNGHDFWLTRNGHGAGFWDRGLGKLGDDLSDAAKTFGSCDAYIGDNGKVYLT